MEIPNKETVHIISGMMRCGTSLLMDAMKAGGMDVAYKESRDKMKDAYSDESFNPNPAGLYELEWMDYNQIGFPVQYKGKTIKCLQDGLARLCVMPKIRICFMRRDFEEIRQSYEGFFGQKLMKDAEKFKQQTDLIIEQMQNRKDTEITVLFYPDVIENPQREFQKLKDNGWNIDVHKAAAVVNPELYRFRLEKLEIGI